MSYVIDDRTLQHATEAAPKVGISRLGYFLNHFASVAVAAVAVGVFPGPVAMGVLLLAAAWVVYNVHGRLANINGEYNAVMTACFVVALLFPVVNLAVGLWLMFCPAAE